MTFPIPVSVYLKGDHTRPYIGQYTPPPTQRGDGQFYPNNKKLGNILPTGPTNGQLVYRIPGSQPIEIVIIPPPRNMPVGWPCIIRPKPLDPTKGKQTYQLQ